MAQVLFFGRLRDIAGGVRTEIQAETLSLLRAALAKANPELGAALAAADVIVAVDRKITRDDVLLTAASEVAFMPPLSGG